MNCLFSFYTNIELSVVHMHAPFTVSFYHTC